MCFCVEMMTGVTLRRRPTPIAAGADCGGVSVCVCVIEISAGDARERLTESRGFAFAVGVFLLLSCAFRGAPTRMTREDKLLAGCADLCCIRVIS